MARDMNFDGRSVLATGLQNRYLFPSGFSVTDCDPPIFTLFNLECSSLDFKSEILFSDNEDDILFLVVDVHTRINRPIVSAKNGISNRY